MADEVPTQEAPETETAELQRELEAWKRRSDELLARLQYAQAEVENTRKRAEREVDQSVRRANEALVARLLPVLDDLDAAVAAVKGTDGKGLVLLRENFLRALAEFGLEEIPAEGVPFDPYVHECVQQVNDDALPDRHVKEVVRRGYSFQMRVLRPAQVVVIKKDEPQKEGEPDA